MRQTTGIRKSPGEKLVKDIKRATRKHYSSEEKIRIVLDGLRGEDSIAELCRREGLSQGIYYKWSKDFMELGSADWLATPPVLPRLTKSKTCAKRPVT
jgi:transposase